MSKSGYTNQKVVNESTCSKLPAEYAAIVHGELIQFSENKYCGGSEIESPQGIWMQICI